MLLRTVLALSAAASLASAGVALAKPPAQFVTSALQGDNSEIALGRMAESRGASPGVREFGKTLEQDHSQGREQALGLARQLHVRPTDQMMPQARAEARKLRHLSGARFDREFARYMVHDHRQDIHDFEEQAHERGPTAELARQTLPVLHKHLEMAQRLEGGGR